jgi:hypothetical protein
MNKMKRQRGFEEESNKEIARKGRKIKKREGERLKKIPKLKAPDENN